MGTSANGSGAGGRNPLIPSWIPSDNDNLPDYFPEESTDHNEDGNDRINDSGDNEDQEVSEPGQNIVDSSQVTNRYRQSRSDFNKYIRSGGVNANALKKALKGYIQKGSGGSVTLARRMKPSASRISSFLGVLNNIQQSGKKNALELFNLSSYNNKPLLDTLSALMDVVFKDTDKPYENTQDDSIAKQAYSNTVNRISETDGIDLDHLTNEHIEIMVAIFIEETIVQRVICDVGNNLTKLITETKVLLDIENNVYQIVHGLVRNQIMPEIKIVQRGNKIDLDKKIENIYRIAFDAISQTND